MTAAEQKLLAQLNYLSARLDCTELLLVAVLGATRHLVNQNAANKPLDFELHKALGQAGAKMALITDEYEKSLDQAEKVGIGALILDS